MVSANSPHAPLSDRLQQDQQSIHHKIDEWHAWWHELEEYGTPRFGEMGMRLDEIRELLMLHFQREEQASGFPRIIQANPKQKRAVKRLLKQHEQLLKELRSLADSLRQCADGRIGWGAAKQDFESFLTKLEEHEQQEARLIAEFKGELDQTATE